MTQHVYTSLKPSFLEFHEYVNQYGTAEEQSVHGSGDPASVEYMALYKKWIAAEQIQTHKVVEDDGDEIFLPPPSDVE